jgi:eukaryotic-like serine/threonine-protein kinase
VADPARLLALAEAVADGRDVDWQEAESSTIDDERELVRQLRLIAGVATTHTSDRARRDDTDEQPATTSWGALEIRERIGAGSYGTVYRAWDPRLGRDVALKLLQREHPRGDAASTIVEEGRLLAQVRHPHVITVHGADRIDGQVGIWMELLKGKTLDEVLHQNGPQSAREAALVGIDLCSALAAVHQQGVVHGDIKAANVMREEGGRIVLADFGSGGEAAPELARRTGTPRYMAPEVLAGATNTVRSDIYAVGVLLFRLVTMGYPVPGRTADEVRNAHQRHERQTLRDVRPDLPAWFVQIVDRALAADPAERFQSAGALESALADALRKTERTTIRWQIPAAVAALVALLAGGLWLMRDRAPAPPATPPIAAIAVLPFANHTGDPAQDYFAAGLTDMLVADLGSIRTLRVVFVRQAALSGDEPARAPLLAKLNVNALLEASVQRSSDRVRVTARLVQAGAPAGAVLWSQSYEGAAGDAFALQSRIVNDVARQVAGFDKSGSPAVVRASRRYSPSPDVQEAYLRGLYLMYSLRVADLQQARTVLERAVQLDASYAPAHAALATTYLALGTAGQLSPGEVRSLANTAAVTANNLDPTISHVALAIADIRFRLDWNWSAADEAYRTAIDLNPSNLQARSGYARYLAAAGRTREALEEARRAYATDPLSDEAYSLVGLMLYYERRYADAIAHYTQRPTGPAPAGHFLLGRAYAENLQYAEAIAEMERALNGAGNRTSIQSELGRVLAISGDVVRARNLLSDLESRRTSGTEYVAPQDLAYLHIGLGEIDEAFRLLNEAIDEHASRLLWLAVDPRVDSLRADARFAMLLQRLGIPH